MGSRLFKEQKRSKHGKLAGEQTALCSLGNIAALRLKLFPTEFRKRLLLTVRVDKSWSKLSNYSTVLKKATRTNVITEIKNFARFSLSEALIANDIC